LSNAYGEKDDKPQDTGRMGFRWPEEPPDGRPVIAASPFWTSDGEQATYELAVRQHPKRPDEVPSEYIARIAGIAARRWQAKRDAVADLVRRTAMPPPQRSLTDAEWNERNNALQAQREKL
jgi:hypothetical protein